MQYNFDREPYNYDLEPNYATGTDTANSIGNSILSQIPGGQAAGQAFDTLLSFIPDGKLKDALNNAKFGMLGYLVNAVIGRKYQTGQYRLGERLMRHIMQQNITSNSQVPDSVVPAAQSFFTIALGVDINNDEDLQALDSGISAYKLRPDKTNIPDAAIQRAVEIKKHWPMYINNNPANGWFIPWPIDVIYSIPSDPKTMAYHSNLINQDMPVSIQTKSGVSNIKKSFPWIWVLVAIAIVVIIILFIKIKHKNK